MPIDVSSVLRRLDQLEMQIAQGERRAPEVSAWSVGQHIEHVLRATSSLTVMIFRGRKPEGQCRQRVIKRQLLDQGFIPRGVAQAPDATLPGSKTSPQELLKLLLNTRARVEKLPDAEADSVADHPYLGALDVAEAIRFTEIHIDHHLGIMEEICDSSSDRVRP